MKWINWQVRHGDQPWYPHVLWPLRWTIAHSTWMVPLLKESLEVSHLFRCFTHTPRSSGAVNWGPDNGMKVRMKENGDEMRMKMKWKLLNQDPERGNAAKEKRNQEKTPTPTHLARSGQTLVPFMLLCMSAKAWASKKKGCFRSDPRGQQDSKEWWSHAQRPAV